MKRDFSVLFCLLVWGINLYAQAGGAGIGMPKDYSEAELKALLDNPRVVPGTTPEVTELSKDSRGIVWIKTFSDVEMVSSVPIDKIYRVLNDFANYKNNFANSQGAEELEKTSGGIMVEDWAGLSKSLGISYVYIQSEPINTQDEHLVIRKSDKGEKGDGENDVQNMDTEYYFKTVTIDGQPYTYMRDRDYTEYRKLAIVGNTQVEKFKTGDLSGHLDGLKQLAALGQKY